MLYIACDHAGYPLKTKLVEFLRKEGVEFIDLGTNSTESVDFPVYSRKLTQLVRENEANRGILICGSGIGMSICANREAGIRAALCDNVDVVRLARQHNDANILVLAGRRTRTCKAKRMVKTFLETETLGGKYLRRMQMIDEF